MTAIRNEFCSHPSATLADKLLEIEIEASAQRAMAYMEHGRHLNATSSIHLMQELRAGRRAKLVALVEGKPQPRFTLPPEKMGSVYTTGHCFQKQQPGGCKMHNLHCGYPDCDRRPVDPPTPQGETS